MNSPFVRLGLILLIMLSFTLRTLAQTAVQLNIPGGVNVGSFDGPDQVQGWEFYTASEITVAGLGIYDGWDGDGLIDPHTVAIWTGEGDLVVSVNIPSGEAAPYESYFRFANISPVVLEAGRTYVIGALMPAPGSDYLAGWSRESWEPDYIVFDERILFSAYRSGLSPGEIRFPEERVTDIVGSFGPNFMIQVPEPTVSSLILLCTLLRVWTLGRRPCRNSAYTARGVIQNV